MGTGGLPGGHEAGGAPYPPVCAPWWPSGAHLLLYEVFRPRKIISKLLGRDSAAIRWNLGGTNLGLRRSCSTMETSLWEGEIITTSSPTILSSGGGQSPSTSSPAPSPFKNLVHLLYPILYQNHKLVPVG